jgi:choline dehydrogenase-like flavoprotein
MNLYYDETGKDLFKSGFLRIVGGSTWGWRGNTPRFIPSDFQLSTLYGVGADWPITYDDLEGDYCDAEDELGVAGNHAEWDGLFGAHRGRRFPMEGIAPSYGDKLARKAISGLAIDGVKIQPVTVPQARNSKQYRGRSACQGNSTCIPICPSGAKYDASVHLKEARKNGVKLQEHSVVTRLAAEPNGQVHAVFYKDWKTAEKAEQQVTAKVVVLAANAIEIPKLWLLSGLGNQSDQVGRNLMDHLAGETTGLFPQPVYPFRGPQSTLSIEQFRDGPFRGNCGAFRMTIGNDGWGRTESPAKSLEKLMFDPGPPPRLRRYGRRLQEAVRDRVTRMLRVSYSTEMLPIADNRVELSDKKDALGLPRPQVTFQLDDYSKRALAYGHSVTRRIWAHLEQLGAEEVAPVQPTFEFNGAGHIMGTMRMGTNPASSVVDSNGRSHEHDNLYVVGSSVFVTSGTANPTLTLAALTIRTARSIGP